MELQDANVGSSDAADGGLAPVAAAFVPYEQQLKADLRWAMADASRFFEGQGKVQETLLRVTSKLADNNIPYAVVGGMALFAHGLRRFTEDVDILVTRDGLDRLHQALDGLGYLRPYEKSKNLRDVQSGVRIEFLITGDYPGDGKPKPVSFPSPDDVSEVHSDGVKYIALPAFVTLKLASGMTNRDRAKDLLDVEQLIKELPLSRSYAEQLHPFVRERYLAIWDACRISSTRFLKIWKLPPGSAPPNSLDDVRRASERDQELLSDMIADGVALDVEESSSSEAVLFTHDLVVATKYDMREEGKLG